jgi:ATP-dependent DNA helicase RecG
MSMIRDQSFGIQSQKSIPDTNIDMLNRDALTDFRGEVRHWGLVSHLDSVSDEDFCKGVGITDHSGQLTYGGLIMLGKSPYTFNFVPTFCADYVEIPGTGLEAMTKNYTYRIPEQQNLWEASRVILRRLRTLVNTPMVGINERGQSVEDFSEYDILREAMANQMAHADHFSPRRSCIHVFDDRIEFLNPGGMPMPLDVMESSFESQPRNPVIAKLFRLAHLSENLGYGLRKLKRWQEVTNRPMHIETTINSVKVTFDLQTREAEKTDVAKNVAKNLTERQQQIIALISENPQTTRAEIAFTIGVATKTIERELAALSDIVQYVGSKKGGHWELQYNI